MKLPLTLAALVLLLISFAPPARGQQKTCSCSAPDKKCQIKEITCPHGCTAVCAPDQACFATCRNPQIDRRHARISIKVDPTDSAEKIGKDLTAASGRRIKFIPSGGRLSFQLDEGPLWDALTFLSQNGKVFLDGVDFDNIRNIRGKLKRGEKISVNYNGIPVQYALADLSFLSGLTIRAKSGNAEQLFSLTLPEATLKEVISKISKKTGVKIERNVAESASAN